MDVLFDARILNRSLSGLERVQLNLLRELALLPGISRLRVVLLHNTHPVKPLPEGVETVEVWTTEDILRVLLDPDQRPDVYHLSWFPDNTPRDLWLPLVAPASVVEVHDAILNRHPEYFPSRDHWRWYHDFVKRLVRNSDRLLAHTKSVAGEIERDLEGDPSIVDVAPLAVDPAFHLPLPVEEVQRRCKRIGVAGDFILAVGKDYPHKDHNSLYRALARLDPSVSLCVAGSRVWGQGGETSDEVIGKLGIRNRVKWVQGLDDEDIKALIQGSKVMAFPSLEEGFGLPPIEAMTLGTPVVAADAMSIPEVCGDGAWLFPAGDDRALEKYLRKAISGGEEVEALVERGRRRAETFSWRRTAELTLSCYENAVATAGDGSSPRPNLGRALEETLAIASRFGQDSAGHELAAWQQRCLGTETHLRQVRTHAKKLEGLLLELGHTPPPPPREEPLSEVPGGQGRRRWSLRRRLRKIREGLKICFR